MRTAIRLSTSMEALAALAAHVRVGAETLDVAPEVHVLLRAIAAELVGEPADGDANQAAVVGMTRTLLRQAIDLVDNPGRAGGWSYTDHALLQGIGQMSASIVEAFKAAGAQLPGLLDYLRGSGRTFLDVGTGTAWLAIATAREYPSLSVEGMDIFENALSLARANVASEGMQRRIRLRMQDITTLHEPDAFDVIWLPLPFLPKEIVAGAITAAVRSLRPGGWLLPGAFGGGVDRLAELLIDLRTLRSGGHPWSADEIVSMLGAAGLTDPCEVPRTWSAPVRLYAARRT